MHWEVIKKLGFGDGFGGVDEGVEPGVVVALGEDLWPPLEFDLWGAPGLSLLGFVRTEMVRGDYDALGLVHFVKEKAMASVRISDDLWVSLDTSHLHGQGLGCCFVLE